MTKKIGLGLILLAITLTVVGCGVSLDDYNLVVSELAQTEQKLAQVQEELTNTQSEMEATETQLAQVQEELTNTQSEMEATETQLAQREVELAEAQSELASVSGTVWTGWESDGDYYEFYFMSDGSLHYKSPTGYWTVATWKQDGNTIYMEFNNKYAERQGTITGNRMEGDGWNITGLRWTWSLKR